MMLVSATIGVFHLVLANRGGRLAVAGQRTCTLFGRLGGRLDRWLAADAGHAAQARRDDAAG